MTGCLALFIGGVRSGEIRPLNVSEMCDVPRKFLDKYILGRVLALPCGCGLVAIYAGLDPIPAVRQAHFATASTIAMMVEQTKDLRVAWTRYLADTEVPHIELTDLEFASEEFCGLIYVMHHKSKLQARLSAKSAHKAGT